MSDKCFFPCIKSILVTVSNLRLWSLQNSKTLHVWFQIFHFTLDYKLWFLNINWFSLHICKTFRSFKNRYKVWSTIFIVRNVVTMSFSFCIRYLIIQTYLRENKIDFISVTHSSKKIQQKVFLFMEKGYGRILCFVPFINV